MSCFAPVYWTVSFRPQRRQRNSPARSAAPCLGAPWLPAPGALSLTISRIASTVPREVTFVRAGPQRQPLLARLAPGADRGAGAVVAHARPGPAVGVGAAVGGGGDDLVGGRVARPSPDHLAVPSPGRQVEPVLEEPQERLPDAAQLGDLVDDQPDRRLHPAVRVLLQPVADLDEADRGRDHEPA